MHRGATMTEKQFWSRKEVCKLFNEAYKHKDVYKHTDQTEGIEILEDLFGVDIYSKDYKIWNGEDELIEQDEDESKRFNLAYEKGEWWAVNDSGICLWKEEVIHTLNELYETNQELYDFRLIYNALLFNIWYKYGEVEVYKARRHHDGSIPFDEPYWFIVVAILPGGRQVTNHYHMRYWRYFKITEYDQMKDEFDGHDSEDVLRRLKGMI